MNRGTGKQRTNRMMPTTDILFTGYAPVHFLCFKPLYQKLRSIEGIRVFVSGGLRTKIDGGHLYDEDALYLPLGVPKKDILSVDEIKRRSFRLLFAGNTKMITPAEFDARIQIFHGISFRNKAVRADNLGADYYFMVGPYMRRRFAEADLFTEEDPRGLNIGFLKTDRLLDGSLNRAKLLAQYGIDGTRPVLLYAPTGQKNNSLETMGIEVIRRIADTNQYDLIIKTHDHPKRPHAECLQILPTLAGPRVHLIDEQDVIPLLYVADVLITDASSVSNEYALLDRPILFLDVPKLIKKALKTKGSMVDLDTWGRRIGEVVKSPDDVLPALEDALTHPLRASTQRQQLVADVFYNPGKSTQAAADWILQKYFAENAVARAVAPVPLEQV